MSIQIKTSTYAKDQNNRRKKKPRWVIFLAFIPLFLFMVYNLVSLIYNYGYDAGLAYKIPKKAEHKLDEIPLRTDTIEMGISEFGSNFNIYKVDGHISADKPYMVKAYHHSLIVYKNGKKIGAFKFIQKPFQLTNLKYK